MKYKDIHIGDIVYFMYENEIRTGIISGINIGIDFGSIHANKKDIVNEEICTVTIALLILVHNHTENKLVYKVLNDSKTSYLKYSVYDVFKTKKQLIKSLESKASRL